MLLILWLGVWTAIVTFSYTWGVKEIVHTVSANMVSSQIVLLLYYVLIPKRLSKPDSYAWSYAIVLFVFHLTFAIVACVKVSYPEEKGYLPFVVAACIAAYNFF